MMSKLKRRTSVVCSLLLAVVMVMPLFAGCGADNKPPEGEKPETHCTVTFDKNTSRNTNVLQPQTVENGKTVKAPTVITIDDNDPDASNRYAVIGWYTSSECKENEKWNFATPVTKSMTLYAAWQEKVKVEFFLDPNGTVANSTQWVIKGEKAEREDALVNNYKLEGYFTSNDFAESSAFDFNTALNADTKLYLKYNTANAYLTATHLSSMTFGWDKYYDDTYPGAVTKHSETTDDETYEYARLDFGNNEQPYVWYNPLNIDIKGKNMLDITYRNVGKGRAIRFYYVMAYAQEGGGHLYSNGSGIPGSLGTFSQLVECNLEAPDGKWHTLSVDMGAQNIEKTAGISEWGTADLLSIFRIDYPYKANGAADYTADKVQAGDSVLEVKEVKFYSSDPEIDYSAKDSDKMKNELAGCDTEVPEGTTAEILTDWVWSVEDGARLYYQANSPRAFFPYGAGVSKLTATVAEGKAVNCDAADKKALFLNLNNWGYATSAKISWITEKEGAEVSGEKNISLESRKNGQVIYMNMANESSWKGNLKSFTIDYVNKGVDNSVSINSIKIATPEAADIPGVSFENGPMGFDDDAWSVGGKTLTVGTAGVTKTAAENGTVLDVDNAVVYKGFTVWYTQGETAATKLTLTYTDENDQEHSKEVELTSDGEGEKSAVFTFLGESGRSAMSGKIKSLKLKTDKGTVAVKQINYDFDVHESYFDMTVKGTATIVEPGEGVVTPGVQSAATATNIGKSMSCNPEGCFVNMQFAYSEDRAAWQFIYNADNAYPILQFAAFLHPVPVKDLTGKIYLVLNNATESEKFSVYLYADNNLANSAAIQPVVTKNMGKGSWVVLEIDIKSIIEGKKNITGLQIVANKAGSVYYRAIIFR